MFDMTKGFHIHTSFDLELEYSIFTGAFNGGKREAGIKR